MQYCLVKNYVQYIVEYTIYIDRCLNVYNEIHLYIIKLYALFSRSEDQEKKIEKLEMQVEAQGHLLREIGNFYIIF